MSNIGKFYRLTVIQNQYSKPPINRYYSTQSRFDGACGTYGRHTPKAPDNGNRVIHNSGATRDSMGGTDEV